MKRNCPNPECSQHSDSATSDPRTQQIVRKGTFYRASDRRYLVRYRCNACKRQFSSATFDPDYRQKRRDVNHAIGTLACSGVSQRRMAKILKLNFKTVVGKFRLLASRARDEHAAWLTSLDPNTITEVQFDDLETSEHTKCKPLSVTLAVIKNSRNIMGFHVSKMPARGHLAKIARKKYPRRPDERMKNWDRFLESLKEFVSPLAHLESDENPHYPKYVKRHFPEARHTRYKGARGAVVGQGELKKLRFDPLFSLNHTCAMFRANLNRLFRKTWCTTKNVQGLVDHLSLYVVYHNRVLLLPSLPCPPNGGSL